MVLVEQFRGELVGLEVFDEKNLNVDLFSGVEPINLCRRRRASFLQT